MCEYHLPLMMTVIVSHLDCGIELLPAGPGPQGMARKGLLHAGQESLHLLTVCLAVGWLLANVLHKPEGRGAVMLDANDLRAGEHQHNAL